MNSHEEMNLFIFNYLINDKTNTALLLDGEWGTGKTYYIKNVLIPFIEEKKKQVVYVSLYGIENTESLSKTIFTESRLKAMNSTAGTVISSTAKTVIRGISSYFGVDLNGGVKEWRKLIKFANLKNKLLIIDDLERHSPEFNIIEILGYINNLCEQDGVKVLLICDENALRTTGLSYEDSEKYKKIKEKTVGDTVKFFQNLDESIASIFKKYDLSCLGNKKKLVEVLKTISNEKGINCFNLRSFSRACQKMLCILIHIKKLQNNDDETFLEFLKVSFFGLIAFYLRLSKDSSLRYPPNCGISSSELGTSCYPLYRYIYDYCIYQTFNDGEFKQALSLFLKQKQGQENNEVISIIKSYYLVEDKELENALKKLKNLIVNGSINCENFTGIATYLIAIKCYFGYEIDDILELMVNKAENGEDSQELLDSLDSYSGYYLEGDCINDFNDFKNKLKEAILNKKCIFKNHSINADNLSQTISNILKNKEKWMISKEGFFAYVNFQGFLEFIQESECKAICLHDIRNMFSSLYTRTSDIANYCSKDIEPLKKFKNGIKQLYEENNLCGKAKKLQLSWLLQNLDGILALLTKGGDNHERI